MLFFPFEMKHMKAPGHFSGYASVFHYEDSDADVVQKGAFVTALKHAQMTGKLPKMLWQHDPKTPIGKWLHMYEDHHGLYVEGQLFLDLEKGKEAYALLKQGVLDGLSIGFSPIKTKRRPQGGREIYDLKLFEISLVTFPANPQATITHLKQKGSSMHDMEQTICDLKETFETYKTEQEDRIQKLETKTRQKALSALRPEVSTVKAYGDPSFRKYIASGIESKALSTGENERGGYLIPEILHDRILDHVRLHSPLRQLARSLTVSSSAVDILINKTDPEAGWVSETEGRAETTAPEISKIKISVHEMYAKPRATQKLLDDAAIDVEEWIVTKIAEKMAVMETQAFISGDGNHKPRGLLTYPLVSKNEFTWGRIETLKTGVNGAFSEENGADILIDTLQSMKSIYLEGACWILSRSALAAVRKLRDSHTGDYLWQPGLAQQPQTLLGYPVVVCDEMPALTSGTASTSIVFANLKEAYQIVDRAGIHILRDPYSAKPYVEFYVTKRLGGDVVNFDAIKAISFAAA